MWHIFVDIFFISFKQVIVIYTYHTQRIGKRHYGWVITSKKSSLYIYLWIIH